MRTTITLDDDVLEAAKKIAAARGVAIGVVISELARRGLVPSASGRVRNGIRLFPIRDGAGLVTSEIVQQLLDETE